MTFQGLAPSECKSRSHPTLWSPSHPHSSSSSNTKANPQPQGRPEEQEAEATDPTQSLSPASSSSSSTSTTPGSSWWARPRPQHPSSSSSSLPLPRPPQLALKTTPPTTSTSLSPRSATTSLRLSARRCRGTRCCRKRRGSTGSRVKGSTRTGRKVVSYPLRIADVVKCTEQGLIEWASEGRRPWLRWLL